MAHRSLRTTRDVRNLQGRPSWYRIQASARVQGVPEVTQVSIYDEIGFLGVSADAFMRDLSAVAGDIELHLNSPGGDVFDGIAIYNQLRQRQGTVSVVVDGLAASAASFIAQAASPGHLAMAPHSQMMIHEGFGMTIGAAADHRQAADLLDKASDNIAGIYADRSGRPASYWRDKMRAETWLSDAEAVAEGLADYVLGQEGPRNSWDLSVYRNAAGGNDGWRMRDGRWVFDPEDDGDDDSSPETDTDHDYWSEDGKQLKPIPPNPATGKGGKPMPGNYAAPGVRNADKYNTEDRRKMAASGEAMSDGSYPIKDEEDLHNAIRAVGRGSGDHDAIRRHIIKRAKAIGHADAIPDNWNADGSLKSSADNSISGSALSALFTTALEGAMK